MTSRLMHFARANWALLALCALATAVAGWFALRIVAGFIYFHDPRNVDVDLKPWMTPRFVVMTYDLPRPVVAEILGLDDAGDRGLKLGKIAAERGMTLEELTQIVRDGALAYRTDPDRDTVPQPPSGQGASE